MFTTTNNFMDSIIKTVGNTFMAIFVAFDTAMNVVTFIAAVAAFIVLAIVITGIAWVIAVDVLPLLFSIVTP